MSRRKMLEETQHTWRLHLNPPDPTGEGECTLEGGDGMEYKRRKEEETGERGDGTADSCWLTPQAKCNMVCFESGKESQRVICNRRT